MLHLLRRDNLHLYARDIAVVAREALGGRAAEMALTTVLDAPNGLAFADYAADGALSWIAITAGARVECFAFDPPITREAPPSPPHVADLAADLARRLPQSGDVHILDGLAGDVRRKVLYLRLAAAAAGPHEIAQFVELAGALDPRSRTVLGRLLQEARTPRASATAAAPDTRRVVRADGSASVRRASTPEPTVGPSAP